MKEVWFFDPLGIVFYCAKGRSISHASVNDSITGQEISHCGRIEFSISKEGDIGLSGIKRASCQATNFFPIIL